jgi:pantoate--beta-alanine ligase
MITVHTVAELRAAVAEWRRKGERVGFVPTMGNLHAGHAALVRRARTASHRVVASVFVNPLQFGPSEDFERYPRTLAADAAILGKERCDLLFAPDLEEMYPGMGDGERAQHTTVTVPGLSDILCGAHRPGHFSGVATVVAKLFGQVQPDLAVFGEKDYQQLLVIRRVVRDLALPIEVIGEPTVREADGLALSSRNQYLTAEQRAQAAALHATLAWAVEQLRGGREVMEVEGSAMARLEDAGFKPEYCQVRDAGTLAEPEAGRPRRVLAAAWLGKARLIDNLPV